jgi:hypothetical protein
MADPAVLNAVIWYSVKGGRAPLPAVASLPAFGLMTAGLLDDDDADNAREVQRVDAGKRDLIARLTGRR